MRGVGVLCVAEADPARPLRAAQNPQRLLQHGRAGVERCDLSSRPLRAAQNATTQSSGLGSGAAVLLVW